MAAIEIVKIESPERFKRALQKLGGGLSLVDLSIKLGHGPAYLSQSISKGRIPRGSFYLLAHLLNESPEELMEFTREPRVPMQSKEITPSDNVTEMLSQIIELQQRQLDAIQRLNGMFERVWCK